MELFVLLDRFGEKFRKMETIKHLGAKKYLGYRVSHDDILICRELSLPKTFD